MRRRERISRYPLPRGEGIQQILATILRYDWSIKSWRDFSEHHFLTRKSTPSTDAITVVVMIDEQEIPGASDKAHLAPSLAASRGSPRARKARFKVLKTRGIPNFQTSPRPRGRKRTTRFAVHEDLPTPPQTQASQASQGGRQRGLDPSTSQKKRRKTAKKPVNNASKLRPYGRIILRPRPPLRQS
jgi:hypothetical protein